jgi:protein gp37
MGKTTEISWCDMTFNPWIGCTKVSSGCKACYAETLMDHRYHKVNWGKGNPRQRTSASNWKQPLKWNRDYERAAEASDDAQCVAPAGSVLPPFAYRPRVFCASLADWLDNEVPIEWLADLLRLIHDTPNLDWL